MKKWMWISITISLIIAFSSVAYYFAYYLPSKDKKTINPEIAGVGDMPSPTSSPTNTPTPTPTNKPRATATPLPTTTPLPTSTPEIETESVRIGIKKYQCQKDKANEVREAKIKRDEALQKVWECTDKCFNNRFVCEDDCKDTYSQNWDNETIKSCYFNCRAVSCNDVCYLYITQAGDYEGILASLINDYCQ